jgi:hypothetical protein
MAFCEEVVLMMKTTQLTLFSVVVTALLMQSCQKHTGGNGNGTGNGTGTGTGTGTEIGKGCKLSIESVSGGPGYVGSYDYHYDANGILSSAYWLNPNNLSELNQALSLSGNIVGFTNGPDLQIGHYYAGDLQTGVPASGWLDVTDDGNTINHLEDYFFTYFEDSTLRSMNSAGESLGITYDSHQNVSSMQVSGNSGLTFTATMEDYDDVPNPFYLEGRYWKFLQHMFDWGYPADYLMVAALCKNNPGKITMKDSDGSGGWVTTMRNIKRYYNSDSLTQTIVVQDTDPSGNITTYQTANFQYNCQ